MCLICASIKETGYAESIRELDEEVISMPGKAECTGMFAFSLHFQREELVGCLIKK